MERDAESEWGGRLAELPDEEFAEHVNSLRTKKLERDRSVDKRCDRLFIEIAGHQNLFDRRDQEVRAKPFSFSTTNPLRLQRPRGAR